MKKTKNKKRLWIIGLILLAILPTILKATNAIDWSWWWVLAPIWAPLVIWLLLIALLCEMIFFMEYLD